MVRTIPLRIEKTEPLTIYPTSSLKRKIESRCRITGRSLNKEILYLIRLALQVGPEAETRALSLLMKHQPAETEQL